MPPRKILSSEQIRAWWSECIRDDGLELKERLKFSELLMKSQGGFREEPAAPAPEQIRITLEE